MSVERCAAAPFLENVGVEVPDDELQHAGGGVAREFATTWPEFDLDPRTRAMLSHASKLTEIPGMVGVNDVEALEAASGLPSDAIPPRARFASAINHE